MKAIQKSHTTKNTIYIDKTANCSRFYLLSYSKSYLLSFQKTL